MYIFQTFDCWSSQQHSFGKDSVYLRPTRFFQSRKAKQKGKNIYDEQRRMKYMANDEINFYVQL